MGLGGHKIVDVRGFHYFSSIFGATDQHQRFGGHRLSPGSNLSNSPNLSMMTTLFPSLFSTETPAG